MNFIKQDLYQRAESKINKPYENEYNSFLIQVFSKSKCKVIDSCVIPITDKTSFDYDFNEKCHEFFLKSFKNLSGFKHLRNCDYSFKMVDFEIDDHDDDDFDLFNDSDNSKNKEKYYFKDFYQIKNEDIDVISVKDRTLCLLHLSGYDLTITFTRIKDSSRFEEAIEKQKAAKKQLVSELFQTSFCYL